MQNERQAPSGKYEDFMTELRVSDVSVWARPVGIAITHDGAPLVSDDANGAIWRVSYVDGRVHSPSAHAPHENPVVLQWCWSGLTGAALVREHPA